MVDGEKLGMVAHGTRRRTIRVRRTTPGCRCAATSDVLGVTATGVVGRLRVDVDAERDLGSERGRAGGRPRALSVRWKLNVEQVTDRRALSTKCATELVSGPPRAR